MFCLFQVCPVTATDTLNRGMNHSLSYSSSCISEFFDAREYNTDAGAPSDEYSSDDESEDDFTSDDEQVRYVKPNVWFTQYFLLQRHRETRGLSVKRI